MKKVLFILLASLFQSNQVVNATSTNPPIKCPSASAIINMGLDLAEPVMGDVWLVGQQGSYETENKWVFLIFVRAKNEESAIEKANVLLPSFSQDSDYANKDFCQYTSYLNENIISFAFVENYYKHSPALRFLEKFQSIMG